MLAWTLGEGHLCQFAERYDSFFWIMWNPRKLLRMSMKKLIQALFLISITDWSVRSFHLTGGFDQLMEEPTLSNVFFPHTPGLEKPNLVPEHRPPVSLVSVDTF